MVRILLWLAMGSLSVWHTLAVVYFLLPPIIFTYPIFFTVLLLHPTYFLSINVALITIAFLFLTLIGSSFRTRSRGKLYKRARVTMVFIQFPLPLVNMLSLPKKFHFLLVWIVLCGTIGYAISPPKTINKALSSFALSFPNSPTTCECMSS